MLAMIRSALSISGCARLIISLISLDSVNSGIVSGERGRPLRLVVLTTIRGEPISGLSRMNLLSARIIRIWRSGILIRMRTVPRSFSSSALTRPIVNPQTATGIPSVRFSPVLDERV